MNEVGTEGVAKNLLWVVILVNAEFLSQGEFQDLINILLSIGRGVE